MWNTGLSAALRCTRWIRSYADVTVDVIVIKLWSCHVRTCQMSNVIGECVLCSRITWLAIAVTINFRRRIAAGAVSLQRPFDGGGEIISWRRNSECDISAVQYDIQLDWPIEKLLRIRFQQNAIHSARITYRLHCTLFCISFADTFRACNCIAYYI